MTSSSIRAAGDVDVVISNNDRAFILSAIRGDGVDPIASGIRLDGRSLLNRRIIRTSHTPPNTIELSLGTTKVIAACHADVAAPRPGRPSEGTIALRIHPRIMISAAAATAPAEVERIAVLTHTIERLIRDSRCVDVESLCIVSGRYVWSLVVDVHILNTDGNATDAIVIAVITALTAFRRADATVINDELKVHSVTDRPPIALAMAHTPITTTFALFKYEQTQSVFIVDPSLKEEACSVGTLIVAVNESGVICGITAVGSPFPPALLDHAILIATDQAVATVDIIHKQAKAIDADMQKHPRHRTTALTSSTTPSLLSKSPPEPTTAKPLLSTHNASVSESDSTMMNIDSS